MANTELLDQQVYLRASEVSGQIALCFCDSAGTELAAFPCQIDNLRSAAHGVVLHLGLPGIECSVRREGRNVVFCLEEPKHPVKEWRLPCERLLEALYQDFPTNGGSQAYLA